MRNNTLYLARILGQRSFLVFCLVTLLIVSILAAVNIASRFALKQYVEDQLRRINWDVSVYQSGDVQAIPEMSNALNGTEGVTQHANLQFLRTSTTSEDVAYIDGKPMRMPWLSLLTTSNPAMLPLSIRPSAGKSVLVLIGTKSQMGNAYAELQNKKRFELKIETGGRSFEVFNVDLEHTIRIERNELNRWFMEQTSSPALIPEIGVILVTPFDQAIWTSFDALARGLVTKTEGGDIHEEAGHYFPDIIHLLKIDTKKLISGWDISGSLENLNNLRKALAASTIAIGPQVFIDNTTGILLDRMNHTAQRVGLISLLVALPLIWMGWILMATLSGMLLLNERRKFGLMRLRGVSGREMGKAIQISIGGGALLGGILGAVLGTALPILFYEGSMLPLETIWKVQPPLILVIFIVIGVVVALAVSRKLVAYASNISPLEASGRVVQSESDQANVKFGWPGLAALVLGGYKVIAWMLSYSVSKTVSWDWLIAIDQALDFAGFPLFVYGLVTLFVSRKHFMNRVLNLIVAIIGGPLHALTAKHISTRPHRVAGFLLIVAMMGTIGLYPTVMTAVFDDKIERGTSVQIGSDVAITLNAADVVSNKHLVNGGIGEQYSAIKERIPEILGALKKAEGVQDAAWTLIEGVSDGVYLPGYGFNGLPLYFVPDAGAYLKAVYSEESLAERGGFKNMIAKLPEGQVLLSHPVTAFTNKKEGDMTFLGRDTEGKNMVGGKVAGSLWYLPGSPLTSITDRESFAAARVDYVNHLFSNNAYVVLDPANPAIRNLDVLITGVHFAVTLKPGAQPQAARASILKSLPVEPSNIRVYDEEVKKVGSDMYIFLARQNVQIYLIGGLLLAAIGILSIAYTNYLQDRRTLGLLRIRGVGPTHMLQFFGPSIFAPSFIGLALGAIVSLVVGYGITNLVWQLRAVKNILLYLTTHIAISHATILITVGLFLMIVAIGLIFSRWAFRRTAREGLSDN
ncbi:MAG: ABC transporter permease [Verrucomicrobiota bacterium]